MPSNGADAVEMLRECVRLAREEQRVIVFVEPIALYMTKDLHEAGDGQWLFPYPAFDEAMPLGEGRVYDEAATDLLIEADGRLHPVEIKKTATPGRDALAGMRALRRVVAQWCGVADAERVGLSLPGIALGDERGIQMSSTVSPATRAPGATSASISTRRPAGRFAAGAISSLSFSRNSSSRSQSPRASNTSPSRNSCSRGAHR